jgi:hypothetical protein
MAPFDIPEEEEEVQECQLEKSWLYSFGMRYVLLWTLSLMEQQGTPTTILKHEVVWMLVFVFPQEKCVTPSQHWLRRSSHQICRDRFGCTLLRNSHYSPIDAPSHYLLFDLSKNPARTLLGQWRDTEEHRGPMGAEEGQEPLQDRNTCSCSLTEDVKYEDCIGI